MTCLPSACVTAAAGYRALTWLDVGLLCRFKFTGSSEAIFSAGAGSHIIQYLILFPRHFSSPRYSCIATRFISAASLSFRPLTDVSPCVYFSPRPQRLCLHSDGLHNGSVGGEGVRVDQGEIHLPPEPGRIPEPRAAGPSAHPEPERLLPQRLEEQQQPALLLQGWGRRFTASVLRLLLRLFISATLLFLIRRLNY